MSKIWFGARFALASVGGVASWLFGGFDYLFIVLIAFVVVDYITGVMSAIVQKKLSSAVGAKGILKKVLIILIIAIGQLIDMLLHSPGVLRTALIFFYVANEGVSIIENAAIIGLPVPETLKKVLAQIKKKGEGDEGGEKNEQN